MAVETGTASGHIDLLDKLVAFLSTNVDLVAAGQQWEILRNSEFPYVGTAPARFAFRNNGGMVLVAPDPWPVDIPATYVKVRFQGKIVAPTSGNYNLSVRVNAQCEVKINGLLVVGLYADNSANSFVNSGSVVLVAGDNDIQIDLINQASNSGMLALGWQKPGDGDFSIIPSANFHTMSAVWGLADYIDPSATAMAAQLATKEVAVRGPGLADADDIYLMIRATSSVGSDLYNWTTRYATGFDPDETTDNQPGASAATRAWTLLWNQDIKYWFVADGRRFIVIAKISTTYASLYGGFCLPYGLPEEYPYPIVVGGSCAISVRWSDQSNNHSSFWNPAGDTGITVTSLYMRRTDGGVAAFKNIYSSSDGSAWTYPYRYNLSFRPSPDESYALQPVVLYASYNGGDVIGELAGVHHISGHNNASENEVVIEGKPYLVVQSGYRTTPNVYAAILLE